MEGSSSAFRFLSREEASNVMRLAEKYHAKDISLPPHILELKIKIEAKTLGAEAFMAALGVVDHGMVNEIVNLKLQLDALYIEWARRV